jgi:hypothetical protein
MSPLASRPTEGDQADTTPRSSSRPSEDPFLAWLARQPVGAPLSAKEQERLAQAKERIASGAPRRSAEDLLAAARALHGQ